MTTQIAPTNRLLRLRLERGWNQADVALFMGVNESTVSLHENGKRSMSAKNVEKYCRLFNIQVVEMFYMIDSDGNIVTELEDEAISEIIKEVTDNMDAEPKPKAVDPIEELDEELDALLDDIEDK